TAQEPQLAAYGPALSPPQVVHLLGQVLNVERSPVLGPEGGGLLRGPGVEVGAIIRGGHASSSDDGAVQRRARELKRRNNIFHLVGRVIQHFRGQFGLIVGELAPVSAFSPSGACRLQAGHGPLAGQIALDLGKRTADTHRSTGLRAWWYRSRCGGF